MFVPNEEKLPKYSVYKPVLGGGRALIINFFKPRFTLRPTSFFRARKSLWLEPVLLRNRKTHRYTPDFLLLFSL